MSDSKEVALQQVDERDARLGVVFDVAINGYAASELSQTDVAMLRKDPRVAYVEPDYRIDLQAQSVPTGINRVLAPGNSALAINEVDDFWVNADVAVIDTGIDYHHPELNVFLAFDCTGWVPCAASTANQWYWHGTHVAGVIGAFDNSQGVVGAAPGARLWDVQVFDLQGTGWVSWTIAGINWVTSRADWVEVANLSLGGAGVSTAQDEALASMVNAGVVPVIAASNNASNAESMNPANSPDGITVSAIADYDGKPGGQSGSTCNDLGPDDTLATFSNWGSAVELAAPGACIDSTLPNNSYGPSWGTSFATPHVAGAAAVLASSSNPQTRGDVEAIKQTLVQGGSLNWDDTSEDGRPEPLLYMDDAPLTATEAATGGWTAVKVPDATVFGAVIPRGAAVTYTFEYGTTAAYGSSTPVGQVQSDQYTVVSAPLTGLSTDQTYHYRLKATSAVDGIVYGADHTLQTSQWTKPSPASPSNAGDEWLEGVSCASQSDCMAVGVYSDPTRRAGFYRRVGGSWAFAGQIPTPAGTENPSIGNVSCPSATTCFVVGSSVASGVNRPFSARWTNGQWSLQTVPLIYAGSEYSGLTDVDCLSATQCLTVGYYKNASGVFVDYSAVWNGSAWYAVSTPNPPDLGSQSLLESVSCASATFCVAVGRYLETDSDERPVIARWNGFSWSLQPSARTTGFSYGVDCPSEAFCIAVGGWGKSETWDGSKWASQSMSFPAGTDGYMWDVSCAAANSCTGIGPYWKGARELGLASTWTGSWKAGAMPHQAEANHRLFGVDCVAASLCTTVGGAQERYWRSLIEDREEIQTGGVTNPLPGQATLNGAVNPGGVPTSVEFQFGQTTSYGRTASGGGAGSGSALVPVSADVKELLPETVYHYRLVATRAGVVTYGKDREFRTPTPQYVLVKMLAKSGAGPGQVNYPWGMDVDAQGNVWAVDNNNNRVQKYDSSGNFLFQFGSMGTGNGQFDSPYDVAVAPSGDVWVTDGGNARVQRFSSSGQYLSKFGSSGTGDGQFVEPVGIDIAANGNIWVADARFYKIQQFSSAGSFVSKVTGFQGPMGLELDEAGNIWVADASANQIHKLSPSGVKLAQFGEAGTGGGQFDEPQALDTKPSGDLLVADRWNDRIQQFTPGGLFVGQFAAGAAVEPRGVVDAGEGLTYVSSSWRDRIEVWQQKVPRAVTDLPTEVGNTSATLKGIVNPRGVPTEYRFEYGLSSSYEYKLANQGAGSGTADSSVNASVSGLTPKTTYYFRLVSTSSEGTVYGKAGQFTTGQASIPASLAAMPVTEPFNGTPQSLANFESKWTALGWANGSTPKGAVTTFGWRAVDAFESVNGARYNTACSGGATGCAGAITMTDNPAGKDRYFSVWIEMPGSGAAKSGYELRMKYASANTYVATIVKWVNGASTTLTQAPAASLANGNMIALVDQGSTVSAWRNTGSGYSQILTANDSAFNEGVAGLEGSGNITRLSSFKAGAL